MRRIVSLHGTNYEVWWPSWRGHREAVVIEVRTSHDGRPIRRMLARNTPAGWRMGRKASQATIDEIVTRAGGGWS